MLPAIIAALAPILVSEVAKAAMGDTPAAGKVAEAAVSVVSHVSGIPITDEHSACNAAQVIQMDPQKLAEVYRLQAEQVLPLLRLDNEDRASARRQAVELAKAGSRIAWGAPVVSLVMVLLPVEAGGVARRGGSTGSAGLPLALETEVASGALSVQQAGVEYRGWRP